MKKALSILLVVLMILACTPLTALAAVASTDVCKIGDTGYATLDAAIAAVKNGETIVLVKDATLSAFNQSAINYTIDGQNKTYTVSTKGSSNGTYIDIGDANVTFKNVKVTLGSEGWSILQNNTNKTGDLTFDNCEIKAYNNSFFKLNGRGNFTLKNSTWEKMSGDATAFYFRGDHKDVTDTECVITVEDSSIINYAGTAGTNIANNNIFHWNSGNGSTAKFYLKGNTVLKNASKTANAVGGSIFYNQQPGSSIIIYADPTVELIMASESTKLTNARFIYTEIGANTTIYGVPKLITTASVASQGIYMPTATGVYSADGKTAYNKWSDGTNNYGSGYKYTGTATSFTPVYDVGTTEGAIAYIKSSNGSISGYYQTLDSAMIALQNGDTIVLIDNVVMTSLNQGAINYTIDGQNKTYTLSTTGSPTSNGGDYINIGNANVTFKDLKMELGTEGWSILQNDNGKTGDFIFDNCEIKTYNNSFVKHNGKGNITFKNTTYDKMSGDATVFYFRGDHAVVNDDECVITIDNSVITNHAGSASMLQNNNIFHINSSAGSTYKFFIKGNSVLKNASETADSTVGCIIHNQQANATVIINAEPTVQFIMDHRSEALTNATFVYSGGIIKINGAPTYVVNDNVAAKGFTLINDSADVSYGNKTKIIGFKSTTDANLFHTSVAAGKLTSGVSLKPVYYNTADFSIQDGAAIRTTGENGIRFSANVTASLAEMLGDNAAFGILIANKKLLLEKNKDFTVENADGSAKPTVILNATSNKAKWQTEGDVKVYRTALVGIPDTAVALATQFVARAYMTVNYADGTSKTFYTTVSSDNVRSIYNVATELEDSNSEIVKNIKKIVEDSGVKAGEPDWPTKSIDIYIIAGQSNAVGTTNYNASILASLWPNYNIGEESVKVYGYCEQNIPVWTNAKAGMGGTTNRIGAEAGMAAVLADYYGGQNVVGILKHAHGGTSLFNNTSGYNAAKGNWVSPSYAQAKGYNYSGLTGGLYRGLIEQVKDGIELLEEEGYGEINIKGVFWMQGEADRGNPAEYEIAFKYFVSDLRRDIGNVVGEDMSKLPIMVGEISRTCSSGSPSSVATNETFIAMQRGLANKINDVYIISSGQYEINTWDGSKDTNGQDAWHWTTEPMFRIGELVGKCILEQILKVKDYT